MKRKTKRDRSIILRLFVIGACAYFAVTLSMLWRSLNQSKKELELLRHQYKSEQNYIDEMKSILDSEDDTPIIEKAARERLGYIYSDEHIFIDISGN